MGIRIKIDPEDLPELPSVMRLDASMRKAGKMKDRRDKRPNNPKRNWREDEDY